MSFWDNLKSAVGIGQPNIYIRVPMPVVKTGESFMGSIDVKAKSRSIPLKELTLIVMKITTTVGKEGAKSEKLKRVFSEKIDMKERVLNSKEEFSIPFEIYLRYTLPPSDKMIRYELRSSLDIPGLDARDRKKITVRKGNAVKQTFEHVKNLVN